MVKYDCEENMQLNKTTWTIQDGEDFKKYLSSFSKGEEKGLWEQRIVNTALPCIAVDSKMVKQLAREISKGNFLDFLHLKLRDNFTLVSINGLLICQIKDFDKMKTYLDDFAENCDNWAHCDTLKLPTKKNPALFFNWAKDYLKSPKPFVKRVGIRILFDYIDQAHIDEIFNLLESQSESQEYYVNMAAAWLLCECFIKQREKTLQFLQKQTLNDFVINKAIQKCRDSFRVSAQDKDMLLKYKRK